MLYSIRQSRADRATLAAYRRAECIRTTVEGVIIGLVFIGAVAYAMAFTGALRPFIG